MIDMAISGWSLIGAAMCVGIGLRLGMAVADETVAMIKRWVA